MPHSLIGSFVETLVWNLKIIPSLLHLTSHRKRTIMASATLNTKINLKDTLKLPTTSFPIRSNLTATSATELLQKCTDELYSWQVRWTVSRKSDETIYIF